MLQFRHNNREKKSQSISPTFLSEAPEFCRTVPGPKNKEIPAVSHLKLPVKTRGPSELNRHCTDQLD